MKNCRQILSYFIETYSVNEKIHSRYGTYWSHELFFFSFHSQSYLNLFQPFWPFFLIHNIEGFVYTISSKVDLLFIALVCTIWLSKGVIFRGCSLPRCRTNVVCALCGSDLSLVPCTYQDRPMTLYPNIFGDTWGFRIDKTLYYCRHKVLRELDNGDPHTLSVEALKFHLSNPEQ